MPAAGAAGRSFPTGRKKDGNKKIAELRRDAKPPRAAAGFFLQNFWNPGKNVCYTAQNRMLLPAAGPGGPSAAGPDVKRRRFGECYFYDCSIWYPRNPGKVKLSREAANEIPGVPEPKAAARALKVASIVLGSILLIAIIAVVLLLVVFPPSIKVSPSDGGTEVDPASQSLEISTAMWGASIATVMVKEEKVAADGARYDSRILDGAVRDGRFVLKDGSNPLIPDAQYTVTVTGTVKEIGLSGITSTPVEEVHVFTTIITPMPIIPEDGLVVRYGEEAVLEWNTPIRSFDYELEGIESTAVIDGGEGKTARITLASFSQGQSYPITVSSAESVNGRQMQQPVAGTVVTAPSLGLQLEPGDGITGASTEAHPTLVFSEPVSNPEVIDKVVSVEPRVDGSFSWLEPNRLEFVPAAPWEHLSDVTVSVKGGPDSLRGISGGFIDSDIISTFTTAPYKSIDVDISSQTLTLYENGVAVESFLASTGLPSTSTPLGDYTIYAKITKTDMRGEGYFAPDVPWVLVFMGDYTIHGNYWATAFGQRSSHGCVGLPVETAKYVFEWTPLGTPVHIHE
ncbi:MAG: L,D-transpeptidase [Gaiellales bacterium]|nr:MAG: L,D-transpeptidase [Gaiellales bacterium]